MAEKIIKIVGSACIPEKLENGKNYKLILDADIRGIEEKPDDEGGNDYVHKFQLISAEIIKENGDKVDATRKTTRSKALRDALWYVWQENGSKGEFENFYEYSMNFIISNLSDIIKPRLED